MPMSRNRGSGSGPFLMEMVIAAGFFMLCVAVCLSAFVKADRISKNARDINHAVLAAESLTEEIKAGKYREFWNFPAGWQLQYSSKKLENGKCRDQFQVSADRKQCRCSYLSGGMG